MSERMTVEDSRRGSQWRRLPDQQDGLARWVMTNGYRECDIELGLEQAILDEGLKEYQALLLGIEWQGASADEPSCPRCGGLMPSMTYMYADSAVSMYGVGHRPNCALDAALAAVRESQGGADDDSRAT